jgi:signal transduction histidine kinase
MIRGYHKRQDGTAGQVVIEIADTGDGIPENVLPSVCNPFFTTRAEGTGLGLAIAKRYVAQNGGTLDIASTPGAGTTVRISLPASAVRQERTT